MSPDAPSLASLKIDRTRRPKRRWPLWTAAVVLVLLVAAGVLSRLVGGGALEVATAVVREVPADAGSRTVLNASGYVTARRRATVSSKVTGRVIEVLVEEGLVVEEGQVLARLDRSNVSARLNLARAQLEAARSALEETRVRRHEAGLDLGRMEQLVAKKVASEAELDHARAEVDSLEARLVRQQEEVDVAERQLALYRQDLEDTVIRAPFAGVVVSKNAQPGEMISPMSAGGSFTRTGICTLVDMSSLEIEVDVNESYINRVKAGQRVEATLDAYPDWKIPAHVIAIVPTADRQKATVRVRIGFDQLDPRILPDMGIRVALQEVEAVPETTRSAVLLVPKQALRREQGKDVLFVVADGLASRRAVHLGGERGGDVEVLSGVTAGERVVLVEGTEIADGTRIKEVAP